MHKNQSFRAVKLAVLALVAACLGAGLASAQEVKGRFELPFEVHWGTAVLARGAYSFRFNSGGHLPDYIVVVRDDDKTSTMILQATRDRGYSGHSGLIVERRGNRCTVQSLRLKEADVVIYYPVAKLQPRLLAEGPKLMQRIPILVAQK